MSQHSATDVLKTASDQISNGVSESKCRRYILLRSSGGRLRRIDMSTADVIYSPRDENGQFDARSRNSGLLKA